jgi:hypothetical protein
MFFVQYITAFLAKIQHFISLTKIICFTHNSTSSFGKSSDFAKWFGFSGLK